MDAAHLYRARVHLGRDTEHHRGGGRRRARARPGRGRSSERGSRWWRLLCLLVPVLFAGAGLPLLPAVLVGGWSLRRGPIGNVVAAVAILSAPVILVAMTWNEVNTSLMPYPDNVFRGILGAGGLISPGTAAWGSNVALGPWRRTSDRPTRRDQVAVTA